jgi:hypothetical protein
MSLADTFNKLGQSVMPGVAAKVFPDTMNVVAPTVSTDSGGTQKKTGSTNAYTSVPVTYEQIGRTPQKVEAGGKTISTVLYKLTFPTHTSAGARINIDPKAHRLQVAARGNEPAKTFRLIAAPDVAGVVFEAVCMKEN